MIKRLVLIVLFTALIASAQQPRTVDKKFIFVGVVMELGAAYDIETTMNVWRVCPRCEETNALMRPIARNRMAMYGVQTGINTGIMGIAYLFKRDKDKSWYFLPFMYTGIHVTAGSFNIRVALRH